MHVAARYRGTPRPKFTKFEEQASISHTPNHVKFRHTATSVGDIRCREFVLPEKVDQTSPK